MAIAKSKLLFCLIPLLLLHAILATQIGVAISVTKSIYFPEFDASVNPRIIEDVKLLGSAKFCVDKQSIQIPDSGGSDDIRHRAGRAIYSSPIRVFDPDTRTPASFDTTFSFRFNNHSLPIYNHTSGEEAHGGSGLTFLIAPDEFTVGRPGPWLGMLNDACDDNYYKFVAVEFNTRCNPEYGDPNDNHIGINLGSIVSKTTINASIYGLAFEDGSIHRVRIVYNGPTRKMDIQVGSNSVFSDKIDISPYLNEYMFVGFSASTGNRTQIHNILSWNFTSTSPAVLRYPSSETCESKIFVGKNLIEDKKDEPVKEEKKPSTTFLIFICVVALFLVILLNLYCNRSSARSSRSGSAFFGLPEKNYRPRPPNKPHRFTSTELSLATKGFSDTEILGSDSSGVLHKGTLTNGFLVAVKRFSIQLLGSLSMDRRRFMKRVGSLSRIKHPGLVPIRGWCYDSREFMIVYEYMFNGCLDKWLFGVGVLPWSRRFKVVKNIANGLSHLHSHDLAHNNVQVSSVFLDVSFKALLGDFGLGDPIGIDPSSSRSIDVFNFGIFVLEVVAGRKRKVETPTSDRSVDEVGMMDVLDYAWMMHETNEKIKIVDRRMGSGVDREEAARVVNVALLCTLSEANGRPKMEDVVKYLKMEESLPELPRNRPVVLFPYNSGPALCGGYVCAPYPFK